MWGKIIKADELVYECPLRATPKFFAQSLEKLCLLVN